MADSKNKMDKNVVADGKAAEIWFEKNWKKCLIAIVVLLVVGMAVFSITYIKKQKDAEAAKALVDAKVADLPALLEQTPNAPGAAIARIRLADDLVAKKDYAGAKKQFTAVANDNSAAAELRSRAKLSAASCEELSGNSKAAAEAFAAVMNDTSVSPLVRDEAGYHAGRIFITLNDARGKEILQKLANTPVDAKAAPDKMPNPWKNNAKALLSQVK